MIFYGKYSYFGRNWRYGEVFGQKVIASYHVCVTSRKVHKSTDNVTYYQGDAHNDNFLKSILKNEKWLAIIDFMHYGTEEFKKRYQLLLANTAQYVFLSSSRVYAASETLLTEESPRLVDKIIDKDFISQMTTLWLRQDRKTC
mgnify:CR=1 FL=1